MNEIWMHPNNLDRLVAQHIDKIATGPSWITCHDLVAGGIRINTAKYLPEFKWMPPTDSKFCGYGPEDEIWMRPLKIGILAPVAFSFPNYRSLMQIVEETMIRPTIGPYGLPNGFNGSEFGNPSGSTASSDLTMKALLRSIESIIPPLMPFRPIVPLNF